MTDLSIHGKAAVLAMSSQEIAELTGKRHDNVMADIRKMLVELHGEDRLLSFQETVERQNPSGGSPIKSTCFNLPKRETLILVSGYNVQMRAAIIDRWQQLEEQLSAPALPKSLPEALRLAADLAEQKALAEQQRDEAIATKALIGSKREATAMATAAAAKREAHKLEVELDRSKMYASVKRVEREYPGQKINWRVLKRKSEEVGIPSIDVFDQNYGSVKAYHAEVWRKAYSIEIAQAKGAAHA